MKRKQKWIPRVGRSYFFITFDPDEIEFQCDEEVYELEDSDEFDMPIFSSASECLSMCEYLNRIIEEIRN